VDGTWTWTMPADQVLNGGFWYKVTAGDAETAEFQVKVVPIPQVREFDVTYDYRPYLRPRRAGKVYPRSVFSGLKAPRGTEVSLVVRTNCILTEGWLVLDLAGQNAKTDLPGQILPNDPEAMRFPKFVLDRPGSFTVLFTSKEKEKNIDRSPYRIEVIPDNGPKVVLTKPGKDIELPPNGTLELEGAATDDFGVKSLALHMQVKGGKKLAPQVYRPGKKFQFDNGTYPQLIQYKDFVALEKVKTDKGVAFPLTKGMVLEYWLQATDNSDYPDKNGQTGVSKTYQVTIREPDKDQKKQQQDRKQAQKQQKAHEQKQDQELNQENKARQEDSQDPANTNNKSPEDQARENKNQEIERKIQDQLNEQKQGQDPNKGEAKGQEGPEPEAKGNEKQGDSPEAKEKDAQADKQEAGKNKEGGGMDSPPDKNSHAKDEGAKPAGNDNQNSEAKDGGQENPDAGPKGTADKNDPTQKNPQPQAGKSEAKDRQPNQEPGNAKDQGMKGAQENPAQKKDNEPPGKGAEPSAKGDPMQPGKEQSTPKAKDDKSGGGQDGPNPGQGDAKPGPKEKEEVAKSKEKGKKGENPEASGVKDGGPATAEDKQHGGAKSSETTEVKGAAKEGEKGPQGANEPMVKGDGDKGPPGGAPKNATPEQQQKAAQARPEGGSGDKKPPAQELTRDQINKLIKDLQSKDPEKQTEAEKELNRAIREAQDRKARDAAEDGLNDNNKGQFPAKGSKEEGTQSEKKEGPGDAGDGNEPGKSKSGKKEEGPAGEVKGDEGQGKEPGEVQAKSRPSSSGTRGGNFGTQDDLKGSTPNESFGKRAGDLNLEELKNRVNEKVLKKAGVSKQEWEQYLKDQRAHAEWLRKNQARIAKGSSEKTPGGASKLPSIRPLPIDPSTPTNVDPIQNGRPLPPPEFREAQRLFTAPPAPSKK
jgi:hypothetical protein